MTGGDRWLEDFGVGWGGRNLVVKEATKKQGMMNLSLRIVR